MAGAAGGFVTRSFESMLKECSGKKYGELRKALQAYLDCTKEVNRLGSTIEIESANLPSIESGTSAEVDVISADAQESTSASTDGADSVVQLDDSTTMANITENLVCAGTILEGTNLELVLQPIRLAFETKNVKLVESALDCLHKLIAYDHLEGDPGLDCGINSSIFTEILTMVYGCIDNSSSDSTILQVLKVLITAVASTKFRVHGEPLLGVIKICYNIALSSKSTINQATAKAMLTQMISITIRRMESGQTACLPTSCPEESGEVVSPANYPEDFPIVGETSNGGEDTNDDKGEKNLTLGDALSMNREKEISPTSVEELQNLAVGADIKGLEAVLDKAVNIEDGKKVSRGISLENVAIEQRDALLVFRTLCKMGMKEESDDVTVKTRLLSLELLQSLLEGVSQSFTKNFHFLDSVKAYLSYCLLRASVSVSPVVFQYATGIFAVLLLRFRESLKGEIGIFFPVTVLRLLDSADSLVNQRTSVLRMLENVCLDSQMLADIFVNYDCDLDSPNLFERMVNALSRIAQGAQKAEPSSTSPLQSTSIKSASLQCLVNVLKSLVDWEKSQRGTGKVSAITCIEEENLSMEPNSTEEVQGGKGESHQFEKAKAHKSILEAAVSEFNRRPGKGIEFLISNKLVENTASSVALFLKNTPNLDKVIVGEYLGQHEEFPLAVMHAYVDSMKFMGLKFDVAIREFLGGFRLPGEAQKIDRIMEKFAERYCADNPGLFKSADAAYILAYAVIMLNTDAHNPLVWPKMSKLDFIRLNSTIDGEECAPQEFLEELYDSIINEEIQIKNGTSSAAESNKFRHETDDRGRIVSILNLALPRRKSATDMKTKSEQIIKQTQALFRKQGPQRGIFYTAKQAELVRPMLEVVGWPLLATFSVIMEEEDSKPRVFLCMEGFKAGIHLTRILGMDTMRYAFLTSLVRFTFLHAPKEMRGKNVESLRMLLSFCDTETDALQDTWNAVLECVSRLELIISSPSISATVMQGSNQISRDSIVQSLKELAGKPAEQVFVNSVKLPSDSVVEFFTALCGVSAEELKQSPARVFSLQKLVETSYYNMSRIRLVWARIWSVLAYHFITAGSHSDEKIAMYAIDSLRQLGMKYLERAELANFTFQNDILKPFVILMRHSRSGTIRGLIIDCIVQMIKSKVGSIKSGWKSVFMIFTAAADDDLESIIESAFENVEEVVLEHFDQVVGDCFMDCVNCLIRFANNKSSARISLKAIALLRICEDRLAEGLVPGGALKPVDDDLDKNFDLIEHYWFPMLAGLSDLTLDSRMEIRNCALEVLFDLLNERGHKFSTSFWENIFHRVLFPIFHQVRYTGRDGFVSSEDKWIHDTIIHSLQLLCNLFNSFYKEVSFMLPPLLGLLLDCAKRMDQSVVSISLRALVLLIEVGGHQFRDEDWDTLLKEIRDASYTTQPLELFDSLVSSNPKHQDIQTVEVVTDKEITLGDSPTYDDGSLKTHHDSSFNDSAGKYLTSVQTKDPDIRTQTNFEDSEVENQKPSDAGYLQRSQTFGQRIMGNVMDNIFIRSFTFRPRKEEDIPTPPSPLRDEECESSLKDEDEETPLLEMVRAKCITQMLLLGALNNIQEKYWNNLKPPQKIAIMDNLLSFLEFAASYNSYSNLRVRIHQTPLNRPPLNLIRQEITGTGIYLDILLKSTSQCDNEKDDRGDNLDGDTILRNDTNGMKISSDDEKLKAIAEDKLVSFCAQTLTEASALQSSVVESGSVDIHQVLELRAPIIVKVIHGMCAMDNQILRRHFRELYPLITKLVCCNQLDVRGALGALFNKQLAMLLP